MFVGFIAVIVILLVIVGLMSSGVLGGSQNSSYITEAKKAHSLLSSMRGESKFYYAKGETFEGIGMDYYQANKFGGSQMKTDAGIGGMNSADWDGWPTTSDNGGVFPDPYNGYYMTLGGTAGDDYRIIVTAVNEGRNASFFILKRKGTTTPEVFGKILEKTLSSDPSYIGG